MRHLFMLLARIWDAAAAGIDTLRGERHECRWHDPPCRTVVGADDIFCTPHAAAELARHQPIDQEAT